MNTFPDYSGEFDATLIQDDPMSYMTGFLIFPVFFLLFGLCSANPLCLFCCSRTRRPLRCCWFCRRSDHSQKVRDEAAKGEWHAGGACPCNCGCIPEPSRKRKRAARPTAKISSSFVFCDRCS